MLSGPARHLRFYVHRFSVRFQQVAAFKMPVTRSSSRASVMSIHSLVDTPAASPEPSPAANNRKGKRKATTLPRNASKKKKAIHGDVQPEMNLITPEEAANSGLLPPPPIPAETRSMVPAVLSFSFSAAKQHLIHADARFEDIFERMKCKPFEHLEQFDPFSTLASSILGQQISWKAARSIKHRFIRLFNPALPEKPDDYNMVDYFPTAAEVARIDVTSLRTAGLSLRKAEYVLDLAARFADGRLSTEKLLQADDEQLYEMLIAVRGIGRWTVDMFAIFSLRRPDILPVGDLGVQRGIVRWFLSLHALDYSVPISPEKLPTMSEDQTSATTPISAAGSSSQPRVLDPDVLPSLGGYEESSIPAAPAVEDDTTANLRVVEADGLPVPFTPSINKTLNMKVTRSGEPVQPLAPLPVGMTIAMLRGRLDPKKKVKGAFLTPKEMEDMTESWRPYRSLGVYYMWALAEDTNAG